MQIYKVFQFPSTNKKKSQKGTNELFVKQVKNLNNYMFLFFVLNELFVEYFVNLLLFGLIFFFLFGLFLLLFGLFFRVVLETQQIVATVEVSVSHKSKSK